MLPTPGAPNCADGPSLVGGETPHTPTHPAAFERIFISVLARDPCSGDAETNPGGELAGVRVLVEIDGIRRPDADVDLGFASVDGLYGQWEEDLSQDGYPNGTVVRYLIRAENLWGERTYLSAQGELAEEDWEAAFRFSVGFVAPPLVINEVFPDPDAGFVELLNGGRVPLSLDDCRLQTFDAGGEELGTFAFPAGTLMEAGAFAAFDHTELSAAGSVRLSVLDYGSYAVVDEVAWSDLPQARSWARVPDGDERFVVGIPTPGAGNEEAPVDFIRGDCNEDGVVDSAPQAENTDLAVLWDYLSGVGEPPACEDRLDVNDDGRITVSDPICFLRNYLYADTPALPPPFPEPGPDPTPDWLTCR